MDADLHPSGLAGSGLTGPDCRLSCACIVTFKLCRMGQMLGPWSLPGSQDARLYFRGMFVREELALDLGFDVAQARLARLMHDGSLRSASEGAYDNGLVLLIRVGPLGEMPGVSKLVRVHFRELVTREDSAVLTLRWDATGPGGRLFPALDADITLTPAGEEETRLTLAGAYRPPLAALGSGLDKAILGRVASATIRSLLGRLAVAIIQEESIAGWTEYVSDAGTLRWTAPEEF